MKIILIKIQKFIKKNKNPVFKAFAYEAAALYNEKIFFDGFLEIPTQGN